MGRNRVSWGSLGWRDLLQKDLAQSLNEHFLTSFPRGGVVA